MKQLPGKCEDGPLSPLDSLAARRAERGTISEDALALSFCTSNPELRYVARWNRWFAWTGSVWAEDETLIVFDRIRRHVRADIEGTSNPAQWTKAATIAAIERLAKSDRRFAATVDQWDTHDWLLNTPDGIIDLNDGATYESDPNLYFTKSTIAAAGGECPTWRRFLEQITGGDQDYIAFLQRVVGYAIAGSTREHALFFLYGSGGNGKGTFLNTIQRVLGDYAAVAPMETFTETRNERHPTELAMLRGARIVIAQETEEGRAWAEAKIKALTGGDPVSARFMRQDFFTYTPKFTLLIAGNHKPALKKVDEAMKRRLHLLPFVKKFTGTDQDQHLGAKLAAEAPGILQWVIDGTREYLENGLQPPKIVNDATAEYFAEQNVLAQWMEECCEFGDEKYERSSILYKSFKTYAINMEALPGKQSDFKAALQNGGYPYHNSNTKGRHHLGLALKIPNQREPHE